MIGFVLFLLPLCISQLEYALAEVYVDRTLAFAGLFLAISLGVMLERSLTSSLVLLLIVGGATVLLAVIGPGISVLGTLRDFTPWASSYLMVGVAVLGACSVTLWSRHITRTPET